jgi:hypothetical protein
LLTVYVRVTIFYVSDCDVIILKTTLFLCGKKCSRHYQESQRQTLCLFI